jgi:hypothetical protein
MKLDKKYIAIGTGVVVLAYLLWKKSQSNSVANNNVITPQYSKECYDSLKIALQQENIKSPDFEKTFLEKCEKTKNKVNLQVKNNLNNLRATPMPQLDLDLGFMVGKLPNDFVIKSDGYNTTYVKQLAPLGNTSMTVYSKISGRTDGSFGMGSPISITAKEFADAYSVFLKQPK